MKISDLKPAEYNPRKISKDQERKLGIAMKSFGDLSGIIFNRKTGNLICGHQRLKHLDPEWTVKSRAVTDAQGTVAEGYIETPFGRWTYREVDWTEAQEKVANLAANKHGGDWDMPKLNLIIEEIKLTDIDFELTGFDLEDASTLFHDDSNDVSELGGMKFQIVIECASEQQQINLIQDFEERGLKCRPLIL